MIRYKSVTSFIKHTLQGRPFPVSREEQLVPRIDDRFLDCAVYLYPSEDAARHAERIGGSGFLIAMPGFGKGWILDGQCPRNDLYHLYAATSRHLIKHAKMENWIPRTVVRLNTHDGTTDVIPAKVEDWECSDEQDIAVLPIQYDKGYKYLSVPTDCFLTKEIAAARDVGIGDETFMVGRFVSHDGKQKNQPSIRFGHISMMPGDPVYHPSNTSCQQESFLVEIHSISGYSGSPVFVRPFPMPKFAITNSINTVVPSISLGEQRGVPPGGPWLLGVEWGYMGCHDQRQNNTGVSGVVPAWHLQDLLNVKRLVEQRKVQQQEWRNQADQSCSVLTDPS